MGMIVWISCLIGAVFAGAEEEEASERRLESTSPTHKPSK